jgi:hypothetical protein
VIGHRKPSEPTRPIRPPNKAELALLRWLAVEPRPVLMGPIGQCVKRGWCKPAFKHFVEDGLSKTVAIYFVTSLGRRLIDQQDTGRSADPSDHPSGSDAQ